MNGVSPLQRYIYEKSYEWVQANDPLLVDTIKEELRKRSSLEIKLFAISELGDDRMALAMRIYHVARYLETEGE